jgi:KDO2-lipid IV(A) lauroyltransferase
MRHWLEYIPFILLAKLVRALPRRTALALGRRLGALARHLQPRRVAIARDNLARALPELADAERETILVTSFTTLGANFAEMLRIDLVSDAEWQQRYRFDGQEHIDAALALGHGAILLTAHLGFWEAGAYLLARAGYRPAFVAKPMHNPLVDAYFQRMREASGSSYIDSHKGARRIFKTLQENRLVGVLMDQHAGRRKGIAVPFFGRPAWTTPVIAEMAMKFRVPVIPAFARRNGDDGYDLVIAPHFFLEGDGPDAVRDNTARLNRIIEEAVRRDPAQWFWVHRRWRE